MSEAVEFKFNNNAIACVVVNGNPWFRGKDIATLLDYADTKKAIAKHVSEDDHSSLEELMGDRGPPLGIAIVLRYI
ncbi:MAG: Bro-N domain-containing protein [Candidatus Fonsibacter sp.]